MKTKITKVKVPLRIDPFGGITDLEVYCKKIGCDIVNFAIDVYSRDHAWQGISISARQLSAKQINLYVDGAQVDSIDSMSSMYDFRSEKITGLAKILRSLLFLLYTRSVQKDQWMPSSFFDRIPFGLEIQVTNSIPVSTGLGASGALSAGLLKILADYLGQAGVSLQNFDFKTTAWALVYEAEILFPGFEGGFQDQIAAICGGVNRIRSMPQLSEHEVSIDHLKISSTKFATDLETHAVLLYAPRDGSSTDMLKLIESVYREHPLQYEEVYKLIQINGVNFFNQLKNSPNSKDLYDSFFEMVRDCSQVHYSLFKNIVGPVAKYFSEKNNSALTFRECGAGGGGCTLVLFQRDTPQLQIKATIADCQRQIPNIRDFYFKLTDQGLSQMKV